jgi:hypothetical protein
VSNNLLAADFPAIQVVNATYENEFDKSFLPIFSSVSFRRELFSFDAPSVYRLLFP